MQSEPKHKNQKQGVHLARPQNIGMKARPEERTEQEQNRRTVVKWFREKERKERERDVIVLYNEV